MHVAVMPQTNRCTSGAFLPQADATTALLGGRDGWVPTHNLTALLLLAVPGTLHSKIGLMFRLLDR